MSGIQLRLIGAPLPSRDRGPAAARVAIELESRSFGTTAVTRFELLVGARDQTAESLLRRLLDSIPTLPLDQDSADRAATLRRGLERRGEGIGMADSLVAGIVLAHDGILLTRNRRHFERVDGLKLASLAPDFPRRPGQPSISTRVFAQRLVSEPPCASGRARGGAGATLPEKRMGLCGHWRIGRR